MSSIIMPPLRSVANSFILLCPGTVNQVFHETKKAPECSNMERFADKEPWYNSYAMITMGGHYL